MFVVRESLRQSAPAIVDELLAHSFVVVIRILHECIVFQFEAADPRPSGQFRFPVEPIAEITVDQS
jgi:hypothetical protein